MKFAGKRFHIFLSSSLQNEAYFQVQPSDSGKRQHGLCENNGLYSCALISGALCLFGILSKFQDSLESVKVF